MGIGGYVLAYKPFMGSIYGRLHGAPKKYIGRWRANASREASL